jgi:hypothetical protein
MTHTYYVILDDEISAIIPAAQVSCYHGRSIGRGRNITAKVGEVGNYGTVEEVSLWKRLFVCFGSACH